MSSYSGAILYSYTAPWKQPAVFKSAFMGPFEGVRHHHKKSLTTIRAGLASYSKESYEGILQLPNRSDVSYRRIEVSKSVESRINEIALFNHLRIDKYLRYNWTK